MVRSRLAWSFQPESDIRRTVMEGLDRSEESGEVVEDDGPGAVVLPDDGLEVVVLPLDIAEC